MESWILVSDVHPFHRWGKWGPEKEGDLAVLTQWRTLGRNLVPNTLLEKSHLLLCKAKTEALVGSWLQWVGWERVSAFQPEPKISGREMFGLSPAKKSAVSLQGAAEEEGDSLALSTIRNGSQTCKIASFTDIYDSLGCQLQEGPILHPCRSTRHWRVDRWGGSRKAIPPKSVLGHSTGEVAM